MVTLFCGFLQLRLPPNDKVSGEGGPWLPNWRATWPARVRSSDFVSPGGHALNIIAGETEAEIAELENREDRLAFLKDVGLSEPGVDKLVRAAYKMLNLQTFFTVGPKEIRAWTIKKGMTAPLAAGVIHEHFCKEAGKFYIEGKNYVVQDGDILHIRFNV